MIARIVQSEEYTNNVASMIQRHLPPSRHPVPSRETIRRRLTEVGLRSRRPLRKIECRLDIYARTLNLASPDVEPHSLSFTGAGHSIHFQWIPSHVSIEGNERAGFLARTAAVKGVSPRGNLTFSEISTIYKLELNRQIKTPSSPAWYFAKCSGESFRLSSRPLQSTYSRFLSGHTRALMFSNGQKTFPECHWCSSGEVSSNHILLCLGFKKDEVLCDPLLFLDFLQIFGFMGIV
ncbi:RNase H domain-containing protein [Trichonephila clavipes]|nr:RNase H domain-containing protein [Trichonephila clavipes]